MFVTLFHGSADWLMAGGIAALGLIVFGVQLMRGHVGHVAISVAVWIFLYSLHKGSTAGIMTATFGALLMDVIGIRLIAFLGRVGR